MAVHDYVIDNSTGANVRADINNALAAIVSNNSSSSEPSTTKYAYMWWADTTNGILKIRNSANDGWVELLQLDGTLTLEDGSASSPALSFRDDLNTGVYSAAADRFNIAAGGVDYLEIKSDLIVFNDTGADTDFKIEGDTETNLFYVNAGNDQIGIGTSSNYDDSVLEVRKASNGDGVAIRVTNATTTNGSQSGIIFTTTTSDFTSAAIAHKRNDNALIFYNGQSSGGGGFANATERMRLDSSGVLLLGTTTASHFTDRLLTVASSGGAGIEMRAGTSSISQLSFSDGSGNDNSGYRGFISYAHSTDTMNIGVAALNRMVIDSSGNAGIGTTTPSEYHNDGDNLVVGGGSANTGITIASSSATGLGKILFARENPATGTNSRKGLIAYEHQNEAMTFHTGVDERVRIDSSGDVGIGKSSPAYALDIARDAPSGGRVIKIGNNGTHHTSVVSSDTQGLIIFRARITVAANTTTDLVSGYGGNLVLITMQNNGGDDVQQTRIRTNGWSTTSELFFNTYGSNQPTVTFSVASGVLRVNHNHTGPIHFNVAGLLVSGPQSQ
tara:strand:+ start:4099 stop:5769 length:1671 start_codon:yes stop_codon:yes gene_type:complete